MDLISIVIPVYNVEKYLSRCLESVIHQTYPHLEIILVNDGSTDRSGSICDSYQKRDKRISVIHKNNGGASDARNTGIEQASGKFITFVDGDDFVDREYIAFLYHLLIDTGSDISICRYKRYIKNEDLSDAEKNGHTMLYNNVDALKILLYSPERITQASYAKMYKKTLFDGIRYPIHRKYAEDAAVTYKLFYKAEQIAYNPSQYYFYLQRMDGLVRSEFHEGKMDLIRTSEEILHFAHETLPLVEKAAICYAFAQNVQVLILIPYKEEKYKNIVTELMANIKKYRKTVLLDSNVKWTKRLGALACYTSPFLIREFGVFYKKFINKEPVRKG